MLTLTVYLLLLIVISMCEWLNLWQNPPTIKSTLWAEPSSSKGLNISGLWWLTDYFCFLFQNTTSIHTDVIRKPFRKYTEIIIQDFSPTCILSCAAVIELIYQINSKTTKCYWFNFAHKGKDATAFYLFSIIFLHRIVIFFCLVHCISYFDFWISITTLFCIISF